MLFDQHLLIEEHCFMARERAEWVAHLMTAIITNEQIAEIEAFCAEVREGLDNATFEDKRRYFELLDTSVPECCVVSRR